MLCPVRIHDGFGEDVSCVLHLSSALCSCQGTHSIPGNHDVIIGNDDVITDNDDVILDNDDVITDNGDVFLIDFVFVLLPKI